jgi:hypothetical protein
MFMKDLSAAVDKGEFLGPLRMLQRITMSLSFSLTYAVRFETNDPF